jgi:hypothetical protein
MSGVASIATYSSPKRDYEEDPKTIGRRFDGTFSDWKNDHLFNYDWRREVKSASPSQIDTVRARLLFTQRRA